MYNLSLDFKPDRVVYDLTEREYLLIANEAIKSKIGQVANIALNVDIDTGFPCIVASDTINHESIIDLISSAIYTPEEWYIFTEKLLKIMFNTDDVLAEVFYDRYSKQIDNGDYEDMVISVSLYI